MPGTSGGRGAGREAAVCWRRRNLCDVSPVSGHTLGLEPRCREAVFSLTSMSPGEHGAPDTLVLGQGRCPDGAEDGVLPARPPTPASGVLIFRNTIPT